MADDWLRTWIGSSDADHITIGGRDLASEVMGHLTLTELAYFLITQRMPSEGQRRMLDVVLVSLADHGLTPTALAARLTYTAANRAAAARKSRSRVSARRCACVLAIDNFIAHVIYVGNVLCRWAVRAAPAPSTPGREVAAA